MRRPFIIVSMLTMLIVGYVYADENPTPLWQTIADISPSEETLEYLNAVYLDKVGAIGEKYGATGDIQFYMVFVDGEFETLLSTATGYGDDSAYHDAALREELDCFLRTLTIPITGEVKVFWVLEFPID